MTLNAASRAVRACAVVALAALSSCTLATGEQNPRPVGDSGSGTTQGNASADKSLKSPPNTSAEPTWQKADISQFVQASASHEQLNFSAGPQNGTSWIVVSTETEADEPARVVARTSSDGTTWSETQAIAPSDHHQQVVASARAGSSLAVLLRTWAKTPKPSYVLATTKDRKSWTTKPIDFDGLRPEKIALGKAGVIALGYDQEGHVATWTAPHQTQKVRGVDPANTGLVGIAATQGRVAITLTARSVKGQTYNTYVSSDGAATWPQAPEHTISDGATISTLLANNEGFLAVGANPSPQTLRPASWQSDLKGTWTSAATLSTASAARLVGQDNSNLAITTTSQDNEGTVFAVVTGPKLAGGLIIRQSSPTSDWEALEGFAAGVTDINNVAISASSRNTAVLHLGYATKIEHTIIRQDGKFLTPPRPVGGAASTRWLDMSQAPGLRAAVAERRDYRQDGETWRQTSTQNYLKLLSSDPQKTRFTVPEEIAKQGLIVAGRRGTYTLAAATIPIAGADGQTQRRIALFRRAGATGAWEEARGFSRHVGDWKINGLWLAGPDQWILTTTKTGANGPEAVTWLSPDGLSWSYQTKNTQLSGSQLTGACALPDDTAYLVGSLKTNSGGQRAAAWAVRDGQWQEQTPDGLPKEFGSLAGCARSGDMTLLHGKGLSADVVWSTPDGVSLSELWRGQPGERLESMQVLSDGTVVAAGTAYAEGSLGPAVWVRRPGARWESHRVPVVGPAKAVTLVPSGGNLWVCLRVGRSLELWKMPNAEEVLRVPLLALL